MQRHSFEDFIRLLLPLLSNSTSSQTSNNHSLNLPGNKHFKRHFIAKLYYFQDKYNDFAIVIFCFSLSYMRYFSPQRWIRIWIIRTMGAIFSQHG
jgi:hypothetical protein